MAFPDRGVEIKSPEQIERMRAAGLVVGRTLELLCRSASPGTTTGELDAIAEDSIRSAGAVPSFKGYSHPPFPASICASVNDEIVHGIPGDRVLADGDIVSIDCGAIVDG
jgi:methionyl aminopeptidase